MKDLKEFKLIRFEGPFVIAKDEQGNKVKIPKHTYELCADNKYVVGSNYKITTYFTLAISDEWYGR